MSPNLLCLIMWRSRKLYRAERLYSQLKREWDRLNAELSSLTSASQASDGNFIDHEMRGVKDALVLLTVPYQEAEKRFQKAQIKAVRKCAP